MGAQYTLIPDSFVNDNFDFPCQFVVIICTVSPRATNRFANSYERVDPGMDGVLKYWCKYKMFIFLSKSIGYNDETLWLFQIITYYLFVLYLRVHDV